MGSDWTGDVPDRPSGEHISTSIWLMARDLYQSMNRAIEAKAAPFGLSPHACRYLAIIRDRGEATPGELSDFLRVRSPTTLTALRQLESKELVTRVPHAQDGRKSLYRLTDQGARVEAQVRRSAMEVERQAVAGLDGEEIRRLESVVARIRASLNENRNG